MQHLPTGTVTLLFTDMESSTLLLQQLGKCYAEMLEECRQLLRTAFHASGGQEVDTQGDAFLVAFARATDATSAAVAIQRTLFAHAWPEDVVVRVRMGLHTGEPQLATEGYVGLDVHHAARIMSVAHGGQVLLSRTTRDLVEHDLPEGVSLRDLGAHHLKDLQQPSQLFQLVIEGLPTDFPSLKTLDGYPNNLPLQPTPFIGREKEVEAVQQLLLRESSRLVTLTGPGGVGKTRLSLQVAADLSEHFTDGTWFVSLAPISGPDLVIPAISQTLGLWEVRDQAPLEHLKRSLQEKKTLLLLDNFEQVVSAAMSVADLLAGCPRLKVLVTSREVLHVRAERAFPVPALALPDSKHLPDLVALSQYEAVALFIERAQAVKPDFQMTNANAPTVADICIRLDGLPLAIELAAARLKLLPPQALLKRLSHRLLVLTGGSQDLPSRQHTLRNTIQWSYDLLTEQEQRLFRWLSIFVGGCTLEAAEAVCSAPGALGMGILEGVTSLLDKSLLQQTEREGEEPRLLLLETLREYGLEVLEEEGELEAARQAHTTYYLALAEEADHHLYSAEAITWLDRLEREQGNHRAALMYTLSREGEGEVETAVRLGSALTRFWTVRGHLREGRALLEQVYTKSLRSAGPVRAQALYALGALVWFQADYAWIEQIATEGLSLSRQLGDQRFLSGALFELAGLALYRRDYPAAHSLGTEALAVARAAGDTWWIAHILMLLGQLATAQGDLGGAQLLLEEGLALFRARGYQGDIGWSLIYLARTSIAQGDLARARALLEEAVALCQEGGHKSNQAQAIGFLGQVALAQGDLSAAYTLLTESLRLNQEVGNQHSEAWSLFHLASTVGLQGDTARARILYRQGLDLALALRYQRVIVACLEGLAIAATTQGQPLQAARLWGAAEAVRQRGGAALPAGLRPYSEQAQASARTQLGADAFSAAWDQGRTMTVEQVLAAQEHPLLPTAPPIPPATRATLAAKPVIAYPEGLTEREVEVLRLVAQGLTDAQVAEQLVISPRTVNGHLRSIYSKIGVTSRAAATRYAVDHHLA